MIKCAASQYGAGPGSRLGRYYVTDATATLDEGSKDTSFFGHPKGLAILFFTEMWERFSYYGMRGLLIIYLTQHFLFSDERSALMYGAYTALVYVMTIIGGTLADRYLGQRKAVTYGAILLVLGHGLMAFEGSGSRENLISGERSWEIQDEGRGDNRQLFVEEDGELRRMTFDSETYAVVSGFAADGGDVRLNTAELNDEGEIATPAQFEVEEGSRSGMAAICALLGLGCAGEDPVSYVTINGEQYVLEDRGEGDEAHRVILANGQEYRFEEITDTAILIHDAADREDTPTAAVMITLEDGSYSTEVTQEQLYVNILYLALALIIAGVGFLKANISTIVGAMYGLGDTRRDSGFTIFYMGINLGAFLSSVIIGYIGIAYGWKYGFGLAGIGMVAGLLIFLFFQHWLEGRADPPDPEKLKQKVFGPINVEMACYLAGVGIIVVAMAAVMFPQYAGSVLGPLGLGMFALLVGYALFFTKGAERGQMFAAIYFVLAQIPFWALFEQAGSSLNLFTQRFVDKTLFGFEVPAPVFQALNAGYIIIFAPILAWLWMALAKRGRNPSTPVKFAFGVFMAGLGFYSLVLGMNSVGPAAMTPVIFIFLIYWIHTMGELTLSPVGLSVVTKLAPARVVGMTMGAWFLYSGLSNYLASIIASTTGAETIGGELTDVAAAKAGYAAVYSQVGMIAMGIALVMLLISPIIKKMMGDAEKATAATTAQEEGAAP
jgi:amino acid/peptide:H+ symporter